MVKAGLTEDDAAGINFSAMYSLIPVLRKGNFGDTQRFLEIARTSTVSEIKEAVKAYRGIPAREPGKRPDFRATDFDTAARLLMEIEAELEQRGWEFCWSLLDPETENLSASMPEFSREVGHVVRGDAAEVVARVATRKQMAA